MSTWSVSGLLRLPATIESAFMANFGRCARDLGQALGFQRGFCAGVPRPSSGLTRYEQRYRREPVARLCMQWQDDGNEVRVLKVEPEGGLSLPTSVPCGRPGVMGPCRGQPRR